MAHLPADWALKPPWKEEKAKKISVLFTCLVSRFIHLGTANALTTDSSINTLLSFLSRRGEASCKASRVHFVGLKNRLHCHISEMSLGVKTTSQQTKPRSTFPSIHLSKRTTTSRKLNSQVDPLSRLKWGNQDTPLLCNSPVCAKSLIETMQFPLSFSTNYWQPWHSARWRKDQACQYPLPSEVSWYSAQEERITEFVVRHPHDRNEHKGWGNAVNKLRSNNYWIIGGSPVAGNYM